MSQSAEGVVSAPASVVIPTIGRTELLHACLVSLLASDPVPAEILVVDQSGSTAVSDMVRALDADDRILVVASCGRGIARATNQGIRAAHHPTVLITHDDCVVDPDWIGEAMKQHATQSDAIVTGRVLPPANAAYVPSTAVGGEPVDYTGRITSGVLFPANMVFDRKTMMDFGGFDERDGFRVAAEDNDLCYRWLREGRPLRFEPSLVVWHHDWRSPEQLIRTHVAYARGQGAFYAKHLLSRDGHILALLRWDLGEAVRSQWRGMFRRTPRWQDPYREMLGSLLRGVVSEVWRQRNRFF